MKYFNPIDELKLTLDNAPFAWLGTKYYKEFQEEILPKIAEAIVRDKTRNVSYNLIETCAGAMGINIIYHLKKAGEDLSKVNYILNDLDVAVVKYYQSTFKNVSKMQKDMLSVKDLIDNQYKSKKAIMSKDTLDNFIHNKSEDWLNYISKKRISQNHLTASKLVFEHTYAEGYGSRNLPVTISDYLNRFEKRIKNAKKIATILNMPKETTITNKNLLTILKKSYKSADNVLIIDPPYLLTNGKYLNNEPGFEFHKSIAKYLTSPDCQCSWVLFTRTKVAGKNTEQINDELTNFYEKYYPEQYKYKDKYVKNIRLNESTETIISNFSY